MTTTWVKTKDTRIKKRDGVYWARFMKRGRRVEASLETKNFELAKTLVEKIEGKILAGKSWKAEKQLFSDAWIEFLVDKKAGNKVKAGRPKTMREYAFFGTRYYLPYFGDMLLGEIEDEWPAFTKWIVKEFGEIQFFNIRKYMLGFFTWAVAHGKLGAKPYLLDPDAAANKEKEEYSPGKAYTREELARMRKAAEWHGKFYLFMLMAQYMGMRPPGEINQIRKERIDLEHNVITLKRIDTKTRKGRVIPIHAKVRPLLIAQMNASKSDYLFPHAHVHAKSNDPMDRGGFKKVWAKILADAGVEGRLYDFRHTYITHAIAAGVNPAVVAKSTGTSLKIIMDYYLHLQPADLNKAIEGFEL